MNPAPYYETMVEPHLEDLRKYCFYLTKSKWDGEDLFQEALLKAMVYFQNKEPYRDLKGFLLRVARNIWYDECRALKRRRQALPYLRPVQHTDSDYAEISGLMAWIAERFPRRNIEMLLLCDYFGYAMTEIAEMTDTSVSAVKSVLFRTRQRLHDADPSVAAPSVKNGESSFDAERWSKAIMRDLPPAMP